MIDTGSIALAINSETAGRQQWVHLLPSGQFSGRDGRGPWRITDPARLIAETNRRQGDRLPIDYEHQTVHAEANGKPAPAAGWIKGLQARGDGVWGLVEWTDRAAEFIAAKEYRFISPVFQFSKATGEIVSLVHAGLTNTPNLELTALAKVQPVATGADMDDLQPLRGLLSLPDDASVSAIAEAVRSLVEQSAANKVDPAKYVPMEVFQEVTAELHRVHSGMEEAAARQYVEEKCRTGQLFPAMTDWAVALCRVNRPAFDDFVQRTGPRLYDNLFKPIGADRRPPGDSPVASDLQVSINRQMGLSDADFAQFAPKG